MTGMTTRAGILANKFLHKALNRLAERKKKVIKPVSKQKKVSQKISEDFHEKRNFGERVADGVAKLGSSRTFIFIFSGILIVWVIINSYLLAYRNEAFDPYRYILLNLFLSMMVAIQAPIIMMSQKRQAARDLLDAANEYEAKLQTELEIHRMHEKMDELREQEWVELLEYQQQQIRLLEKILLEQLKLKASQTNFNNHPEDHGNGLW